ncbi:MAG TPA: hypothetical protein DEO65_13025 [Bacillus bacterium]|nr:hypothetical protein [Bacillus sp. (in: firmicutes)]
MLFSIIKYTGAAYLVYLGILAFFTRNTLSIGQIQKGDKQSFSTRKSSIYKEAYLQGMVSNTLNPKTVLVYITFMPQFIHLSENVNNQLMILGLLLTGIAVSWFLFVVYLLDYVKKWLHNSLLQKVFHKATGVLLIGFGVKTAV